MNGNAWTRRLRLPVAMALFVVVTLVFATPAVAVLFGAGDGPSVQVSESLLAPTSVSVSVTDGVIEVGDTTLALATTFPLGSNPEVTWISSDESIATVDRYTGVVTAVGLGRVAIVATSVDFSAGAVVGSAMLEVVPTPVTSLDVRWGSASGATDTKLIKGQSVSAVVGDLQPANATNTELNWASSDPAVASVDSSGKVTGVSDGTATITATTTDGSGISDSLTVTVYTPITNITIRYPGGSETARIKDTETASPVAVITPADATIQKVTWSLASTYYSNYVTIDPGTGVITPIQGSFRGYAHIDPVATVVGGGVNGATVRNSNYGCVVIEQTFITSIDVSLTDSSITMGESSQAIATLAPTNATYQTYEWSSSDEAVVTVDGSGVVTPVGIGNARVIATATDDSGVSGWADIEVAPIDVESVDIAWDGEGTESLALERGTTSAVGSVTVSPSSATYQTLSWSSSDESVATVDEYGVVYAVDNGTATITATTTDGTSLSDSVTVDVFTYPEYIWVSEVGGGSIYLSDSETAQAVAQVYPADATNQNIVWSMYMPSDEAYASIDPSTGVITPIQGSFRGWVHVHVKATIVGAGRWGGDIVGTGCVDIYQTSVSSIDVSLSDNSLVIGRDTAVASATVYPANGTYQTYTWSSSDPSVATVDPVTGVVVPQGAGTADIIATASDGSGVSGRATVTVNPVLVESVDVSVDINNLGVGESAVASAVVLPADATDGSVVWSSSNTSVATVDSSGSVLAKSAGSARITATAADGSGISDYVDISVYNILVSSLSISVDPLMVPVGQQTTAQATVEPSNATDKSVFWTSADTSIATIDPDSGVITGVSAGTVRIVAAANDEGGVGRYAYVTVTADSPVESIAVELDPAEVTVGDPSRATATVLPADAWSMAVIWSSSDESVATVNEDGVITTHAPGEATITATSEAPVYVKGMSVAGWMPETVQGSATLTVNDLPPVLVESLAVSVADNTLTPGQTSQATAVAMPADAADTSVSWSSSDEAVATVDAAGVVTAVAEGQVTITATATDGSGVTDSEVITVGAAPVKMSMLTPWLSVTTPRPNTKFYIRSAMTPAASASTAPIYARIQRQRADGSWATVSSVRMGAYYSSPDRSILRGTGKLASRGSYRVRLSYTGSPAYVTAWKTFSVR